MEDWRKKGGENKCTEMGRNEGSGGPRECKVGSQVLCFLMAF